MDKPVKIIIPELRDDLELIDNKPDLFPVKAPVEPRRVKRYYLFLVILMLTTGSLLIKIEFPVSGDAKVIPSSPIIVQSKISGVVAGVYRQSGDKVEAGEEIALIKSEDLRTQVEEFNYKLQMSQSKLKQLKSRIRFLQKMDKRNIFLYKKNIISLTELEKSRLDYDHELEQYGILENELRIVELDFGAAKKALESGTIKSPARGVILGKLEGKRGTVVQKGDEICQIADPEDIVLELPVDETEVRKICLGDQVTIKFLSNGEPVSGSVVKIDSLAGEKATAASNRENVINVQIKPRRISFPIKFGMTARVKIHCGNFLFRKPA